MANTHFVTSNTKPVSKYIRPENSKHGTSFVN